MSTYHNKRYASDADYRERQKAKRKAYYKANPAKWAAYGRKARGLPAPTRPAPIHCELCGQPDVRGLSLDHNHSTGAFRGWLCRMCNLALGNFRDNPVLCRLAAEYLTRDD